MYIDQSGKISLCLTDFMIIHQMCVDMCDYVWCPLTFTVGSWSSYAQWGAYPHTYTLTCTHTLTPTPSHAHTSSHLHPHMHTHPHTCTLTCTHILTPTPSHAHTPSSLAVCLLQWLDVCRLSRGWLFGEGPSGTWDVPLQDHAHFPVQLGIPRLSGAQ